ncbi:MAG: hopanoid biosynthesis-associated protein HpnK [Caulobacteraceae bacterium]
MGSKSEAGRRLVITADDFGASVEVNEAVERAYLEGVLTAASLMVAATAAADAVGRARRLEGLGVGLHLVLTDGVPLLPTAQVSHLVGEDGRFLRPMARAALRMVCLSAARAELRSEIEAQFEAFEATDLTLDHVNSHKHFHLFPMIGREIVRIGARHGLRAVRAPLEPSAPVREIDPQARCASLPERLLARLSASRLRRAGLLAPDQVFGLAWTGAMVETRLTGLIERLRAGLTEIYLHPAAQAEFAGAVPGYRHAEELAALLSPSVRRAVEASGAQLGSFSRFAEAA